MQDKWHERQERRKRVQSGLPLSPRARRERAYFVIDCVAKTALVALGFVAIAAFVMAKCQ